MPFSLATWNERTGFPISVFEAWAIDGIYLNNEFVCFNKDLVDENEEGILSIKETKLVYLLMEEVKKLKKEVEDLKKEG